MLKLLHSNRAFCLQGVSLVKLLLTMALVGFIIMCPRQSWQVSQTQSTPLPAGQTEIEVRRRCDGLKIEPGQGCCRSALCFSWTPCSRRSPSLSSEPRRHREMAQGVTSHNWAEWASVSCLITADSWLSSPPSHPSLVSLPSITPSACSVLLFTSGKGITNDRKRLPNLSSGKTFQS